MIIDSVLLCTAVQCHHQIILDIDDCKLVKEKLTESNSKTKEAEKDEAVENLCVKVFGYVAGGRPVLDSYGFSRSYGSCGKSLEGNQDNNITIVSFREAILSGQWPLIGFF